MFEIEESPLAGVKRVTPRTARDARGAFTKVFHEDLFAKAGLRTDFRESYYSTSRKNVLRGMHFQTPPHDHDKIVYCLSGAVLDVVVDLRRASPTFGQHTAFSLDGASPAGVYIPTGCAHGFLTLTDEALLLYSVTSVYAPNNDTGVRWDTIGFDWPCEAPLISDRDLSFPALADFDTPF